MVATVQIIEKNGAGGTGTQKDSGTVRFKKADNATVDTNNPMTVPGSGFSYSYDKWLRLNVTVAPDNYIENLKFYTDGTNNFTSGIELYVKATTTYTTPAIVTNITGFTNAFTYNSGAALDLGTAQVTGTGEKGDHAQLRMRVGTAVTAGNSGNETATFSYDEA